jgi:Protein phosphatase 2C
MLMMSGNASDPATDENLWQVFGASVRGAAHLRAELPNQDALAWHPHSGSGAAVILAVADGHGSRKYFRSDRGARLAVEAALSVLPTALVDSQMGAPLSLIRQTLEERLPRQLVARWTEVVSSDIAREPLDEELEKLEAELGTSARAAIKSRPVVAYGATLLCVVATSAYYICVQLGDGDIIVVGDDGAATRPVPGDSRLIANETTSLSAEHAWRDFRFHFESLNVTSPALILASTDGYSNSFASPEGFLRVGHDFLDAVREDGLDTVRTALPSWLQQASEQGSGDDITAGLLINRQVVSRVTQLVDPPTQELSPIPSSPDYLDR